MPAVCRWRGAVRNACIKTPRGCRSTPGDNGEDGDAVDPFNPLMPRPVSRSRRRWPTAGRGCRGPACSGPGPDLCRSWHTVRRSSPRYSSPTGRPCLARRTDDEAERLVVNLRVVLGELVVLDLRVVVPAFEAADKAALDLFEHLVAALHVHVARRAHVLGGLAGVLDRERSVGHAEEA